MQKNISGPNKIFEKEQLEGTEYSKIEIEGQASQMLTEATLDHEK